MWFAGNLKIYLLMVTIYLIVGRRHVNANSHVGTQITVDIPAELDHQYAENEDVQQTLVLYECKKKGDDAQLKEAADVVIDLLIELITVIANWMKDQRIYVNATRTHGELDVIVENERTRTVKQNETFIELPNPISDSRGAIDLPLFAECLLSNSKKYNDKIETNRREKIVQDSKNERTNSQPQVAGKMPQKSAVRISNEMHTVEVSAIQVLANVTMLSIVAQLLRY